MLTYVEALKEILDNCRPLASESIDLKHCLRRVLATPLTSSIDLPQFNNSAVDGFGVLVEDLIGASPESPVPLVLIGEVAAGSRQVAAGAGQVAAGAGQVAAIAGIQPHSNSIQLNPGQCVRILTGAPVPGTVEAVVMKEVCQKLDGEPETISVSAATRIGENIRLQGEEIEAGATVLPKGTLITPPVVGVIASLGITALDVYRVPRVAVIATGDELIEPGLPLAEGQIYESNSYALVAALHGLGINEVKRFHCRDTREETTRVLQEALAYADIVISAGGVSVGEYDFVKDVCEEQGVETIFWRIAIKPGKPVYFGVANRTEEAKLVFGLPGNPVSALVTFNLFVKPAIARLQGRVINPRLFQAKAARNLKKKAGRLDFVRGTLKVVTGQRHDTAGYSQTAPRHDTKGGLASDLEVMPTVGQESHMLTGLAKADCLMHFAQDLEFLPEGDYLPVELLSWFE
jgi:molybdopterin molybdotransferase